MNIALDTLWNGRTQALCDIATHVQDFFAKELPKRITARMIWTARAGTNPRCTRWRLRR